MKQLCYCHPNQNLCSFFAAVSIMWNHLSFTLCRIHGQSHIYHRFLVGLILKDCNKLYKESSLKESDCFSLHDSNKHIATASGSYMSFGLNDCIFKYLSMHCHAWIMKSVRALLDYSSKLFKQILYRNESVFDPYMQLITVTVITVSSFHCITVL